ncbi:MAG TPA: CBS domain-containing protein [Streptosporangiaceae bacterium]|nr:CBS domain-containing protein [Streptosporangiaceae bacterium]
MAVNVGDVMTARPRCVTPDTPLSQVAQLMETQDIGAVPILDGDRLVGMVTDRDIVVRAVAREKDPRGMPSREIWSGDLVTVAPGQGLSDALHLMAQHQVRRLPVVDGENRLVGVVSQADIALKAKDKSVGEMVAEISEPPQGPRQL